MTQDWALLRLDKPVSADRIPGLPVITQPADQAQDIVMAGYSRDEAVDHFVGLELPCAPVFNVDETVEDPHLSARGMFVEVEHPRAGTVKVPNFPVKFSETPGEIRSAAPLLGAHSRELLIGVLGISEERFGELVRAGVTSQA